MRRAALCLIVVAAALGLTACPPKTRGAKAPAPEPVLVQGADQVQHAEDVPALTQCERNLRGLAGAARLFSEQRGRDPDPETWPKQLEPFFHAAGALSSVLQCPEDKGTGESSYAMNAHAFAKDAGPEDEVVLFFESTNPTAAGPKDIAWRHTGCALVVTRSGAVRHIAERDLKPEKTPVTATGDTIDEGAIRKDPHVVRW